MKRIFKQVKSAVVENLDQSSRDGLVRFEVKHGDNLRVALPSPHSDVVLRAADKSRTRDFLFLAHALTAVTVLFPQLPYLVAWGQYCRLSGRDDPTASYRACSRPILGPSAVRASGLFC